MSAAGREAFLARLWAVNDALVAAGFHDLSPWWREGIERFLLTGATRWVIRAGRRAGKSSTLCRLAVAWALYGSWTVPPGDVGVVAFVSVSRDEAAQRLRTIAAILDALGVTYARRGDSIEVEGRPLVFKVFTATTTGVVGFTAIAVFCDEVARWQSSDGSANPARHVVGTLLPTITTVPGAFIVLSSSPWSKSDYHAECFDRGDSAGQFTSYAATWTANPTITEQQTRELEPDEATWSREFLALPSDSLLSNWWGSRAILQANVEAGRIGPRPLRPGIIYRIACDVSLSSGGSSDAWGVSVVTSEAGEIDEATGFRLPRFTTIEMCERWPAVGPPSFMAARLYRDVCRRFGNRYVAIDQAGGLAMVEVMKLAGVRPVAIPWVGGEGQGSKYQRYSAVRAALHENALRLPDSPELLSRMARVQSQLTPSGNERIVLPRTRGDHLDDISALVMAASFALEDAPQLAPSRETPDERRRRKQWWERRFANLPVF